MKINFILLALTSLFVTVFGGSGGGAPYVDYCKQCADFTNDCVSKCSGTDRNCVRDCLNKTCHKNFLTGDHRKPTISCDKDCKVSCP
ncbi:hypothetical protein B5807_05621 [Epicoccum nigrum]|uniref:Uncharacterized protein n=1 Tax=Epicoccum nigrum TaxID=105696 RepID=A0A1Y2LZD7_EPING|nr:hypothetical protein B5807_05621 [Epicoccum nigrum]